MVMFERITYNLFWLYEFLFIEQIDEKNWFDVDDAEIAKFNFNIWTVCAGVCNVGVYFSSIYSDVNNIIIYKMIEIRFAGIEYQFKQMYNTIKNQLNSKTVFTFRWQTLFLGSLFSF